MKKTAWILIACLVVIMSVLTACAGPATTSTGTTVTGTATRHGTHDHNHDNNHDNNGVRKATVWRNICDLTIHGYPVF